jgi:hypothetical protein
MTDDAIIKMLATHPLEAHAHIAWEQALALRSIAESLAKLANPAKDANLFPEQRLTEIQFVDRVEPADLEAARPAPGIVHPSQGMLASDVNRDAGRTS